MRKIYTIALAMLFSASAFAQVDETFVFTDADGNVIPDGTTITVSNYEVDEFTEEMIFPSGLYVKNASDANANAGMTVSLTNIDNGEFRHCFPGSCQSFIAPTTKDIINAQGGIKSGESASIMSEWLPEAKGTCTVTYTILKLKSVKPMPPTYTKDATCASVTVNYVYDDNSKDLAGINEVMNDNSSAKNAVYNLAGQKVGVDYKGVVIRNGKKVLVK